MDDHGDMAEMYLTEKRKKMETSFFGDPSLIRYRSTDGTSVSAPVPPFSSPLEARKLEKSLSIVRSRHESMGSSENATESKEELEMLLEAYFVVIDSTLNKLTSVYTPDIMLPFLLLILGLCLCLFISSIKFLFTDKKERILSSHLPMCRIKRLKIIFLNLSQLKEYIDDTEDFINIQLVCFFPF